MLASSIMPVALDSHSCRHAGEETKAPEDAVLLAYIKKVFMPRLPSPSVSSQTVTCMHQKGCCGACEGADMTHSASLLHVCSASKKRSSLHLCGACTDNSCGMCVCRRWLLHVCGACTAHSCCMCGADTEEACCMCMCTYEKCTPSMTVLCITVRWHLPCRFGWIKSNRLDSSRLWARADSAVTMCGRRSKFSLELCGRCAT